MNEQEEVLRYREIATQYDLEYVKAILDFSKFSIKALFLLNGSAAIAMMTLITNILIKNPDLSFKLLNPVSNFAWGACLALLAIIPGYFAHIFCKNKEWDDNKLMCNHVHIRASNKRICNHLKQYSEINNQEEKNKLSCEIAEEMSYQFESEPSLKRNEESFKKNKRKTSILVVMASSLLIMSFYSFIRGINNTKISFLQFGENNTKQQISFSDLSYPGVQITPFPITKPN